MTLGRAGGAASPTPPCGHQEEKTLGGTSQELEAEESKQGAWHYSTVPFLKLLDVALHSLNDDCQQPQGCFSPQGPTSPVRTGVHGDPLRRTAVPVRHLLEWWGRNRQTRQSNKQQLKAATKARHALWLRG